MTGSILSIKSVDKLPEQAWQRRSGKPRTMLRSVKFALQAVAVTSLIGATAPASAGTQLAFHESKTIRTLPVGTIHLRVIDGVGGRLLKAPITWRVLTYGRDDEGERHLLAEAKGATPELVLPAAWYIVYAHLPDQVIRHPVEVTAGRTFQYTLVKPGTGAREHAAAPVPRFR